jgi:hypothetical protein
VLKPDAHALTVFRVLRNGEPRTYTATTFPRDPYAGCDQFARQARAVGWITRAGATGKSDYGVLDVLNENGDIIEDFAIPDASAFRRIADKLHLRVEYDDELPVEASA